MKRICTGPCGQELEVNSDNFHKTVRKTDNETYHYYHAKCKKCRNMEKRHYNEENRDKIKSYNDSYRKKNYEKISKQQLEKYRKKYLET